LIDNTNNTGIWSDVNGTLALIARTGNLIPGSQVVRYGSLNSIPCMNALGRIAFSSTLTGATVTPNVNDKSLWVTDANGVPTLIARSGETMNLAGGAKTIK